MEMTVRSMTHEERNYFYSQSYQLSMQTGLIGYLRADMDSSKNGFFSTFFDFRADLNTDEFKAEFNKVINALRFDEKYGGALKDRSALSAFCQRTPESSFGGNGREYGFRADTTQYTYMLRLNPNKREYNLYCYCYQRKWLDIQLKRAKEGIRFITPDYNEIFRIPDGDKIRIIYPNSIKSDRVCRYIDDYHFEVENRVYHICEFAELMERHNNNVIPLRSSLPEKCFSILESTGQMIVIRRGEKGYVLATMAPDFGSVREGVDALNDAMGVTKAQEAAMVAGSMFGWERLGADPSNYGPDGLLRPFRKKTTTGCIKIIDKEEDR